MEAHVTNPTPTALPSKRITDTASADTHQLVSIALFCGLGLLISLTILMLRHQPFGDWF